MENLYDFYTDVSQPSKISKTLLGEVLGKTTDKETTITISCTIEGQSRNVKLKVTEDQYIQVLNEEHRLVAASGSINTPPRIKVTGMLRTRSQNRYEMAEISEFEIVARIDNSTPPQIVP